MAGTYAPPTPEESYWHASRQPLQVLLFLLPLVLAYEIGLAWFLRSDDGTLTNKAHESLLTFFRTLGVGETGGLYLGGLVIIVVLLIWHLLNRDPWRVDLNVIGFMAVESALLTLPLLAMGLLVQRSFLGPPVDLSKLGLGTKMTISVGAGLYEELVFRMLLIAIVHTLLVDLLKARDRTGAAMAIVVSAAAFTWYHPLRDAAGALSLSRLTFYFLAGLYFGVVYVVRGFGIVVAVHAFYDILTVALFSGDR